MGNVATTVSQIAAHSMSKPSDHPSGVELFDQQAWIEEHLRNNADAPASNVNRVFNFVVQAHPLNGMAFTMANNAAAKAYLSKCTMEEAAPFADAVSMYCFEKLAQEMFEDLDEPEAVVLHNATAKANLAFVALHCSSQAMREKAKALWPRIRI